MDKLLLFQGKNEKGIFTYVIDAERSFLEKTASEYHPTIASYINSAKSIPGRTQILLTALGAGEFWGDNVNGDYFPEVALAHEGSDYGYKTFEQYAKVYKHHVNKDPKASYGDVALSVYNPVFHRVELIVSLLNDRAPDIASRIENGEYPDVSMGCKVPWDECSICGNRAPTRAQYCEHLRHYMGKIPPGFNKKAYAINRFPKFFDISFVLIGADRIAKTLKKVAFVPGNYPTLSSAWLAEKMAERHKEADIKKVIPPDQPPASTDTLSKAKALARNIMEVKAREPELPSEVLDDLAQHPLPRILSTMTMLGIVPKPQEFQRIFMISIGRKSLADDLASRNICFDPTSVTEPRPEHMRSLGLGVHNYDDFLAQKLSPFVSDRSYLAPHLSKRIIIMIKRGSVQNIPHFVKVSEEQVSKERKPFGPMAALLAAAGAYAALVHLAPKEALTGINKLLASPTGIGLATVLGLGLIRSFNSVASPREVGQTIVQNRDPDSNDVHARIEALKLKPFSKVGEAAAPLKFSLGSAAKRLVVGVPAAYMVSGMLQKHRELRPYEEEGNIHSFLRKYPDFVSAAVIADAVSSAYGHPISSRALINKAQKVRAHFAKAAEDSSEELNYVLGSDNIDFSKMADAEEMLRNTLVWPLSFGKANLPGRIVGGLLDQAVMDAGAHLMKKRKKEGHPNQG